MKIGIFGDSYGDPNWLGQRAVQEDTNLKKNKPYFGWYDYLGNDFQVENFSMSCSSLYYSKTLFDQTYSNYDKILFLVTEPGRYYFHNHDTDNLYLKHFAGMNRLERHINDSKRSREDIKKLKIFRDYIINVRNWDLEIYFHNLMVDDIKNKRTDVLIVPCFLNSMPGATKSLHCISLSENLKRQFDDIDYRICHMNEKNNFQFYQNIRDALVNNLKEVNLNF
jgi:hypothetical protein